MFELFKPEMVDGKLPFPHIVTECAHRISDAARLINESSARGYTPLSENHRLGSLLGSGAIVWIKHEEEDPTGSYKRRGSLVALRHCHDGAVTASAGNHAQGFALACDLINVPGTVFMPTITPDFKIQRTLRFGNGRVDIELVGDTFDSAAEAMQKFSKAKGIPIVHPFDNDDVIAGQGTVAIEILHQMREKFIDFLLIPVGGGGLSSGMATWFAINSPRTQIICVEPLGADCMKQSMEAGSIQTLSRLDTFVDGAAVKTPGSRNFALLKLYPNVHYMAVSSGAVSEQMCRIHDDDKHIVEPAGALSFTAATFLREAGYDIANKNIVCVASGGNIAMERWSDIRRRSYEYLGQEKEFTLAVHNSPGSLRTILEQFIDGNQITLLRLDHLEGPDDVACTIRIRNIREPHKIHEFETNIRDAGLLWGDGKQEYEYSTQTSYPYRKHFVLTLPDRPRALLDALQFQGEKINIIGFDYTNSGFDKARCSITVASRDENALLEFAGKLREHGFYLE